MYDQPLPQNILFYMLYAAVAMTAIIASCYLLLRRGNAFAPDNIPPVRLRRWTAAFFASMALGHLWYLPTAFLTSSGDMKLSLYVGVSLDFMIFFPLSIIVMLVIPAVDAERIFTPFVRLSPDEHSLGIGLPLARRLAISMGYNVTLDLNYTNGARFVITGI